MSKQAAAAVCVTEQDPDVTRFKKTLEEIRTKTMRLVDEKMAPDLVRVKTKAFVNRTKSGRPLPRPIPAPEPERTSSNPGVEE